MAIVCTTYSGLTIYLSTRLYTPGVSKTILKGGYPTMCLDCYTCGWWNSTEKGCSNLWSAVQAARRHVYRRYLIRVLSHGTIVGAHTSPLYINQYECLTVSPSAARHHVLVFPCLARQRACLNARSACSILVCGGNWLRSSSPNYSNFRMSRTP